MTSSTRQTDACPNLNGSPQRKIIAPGQLLIGGKWRDSQDGATMTTTDPTTESVITKFAKATPAEAEAAVQAASRRSRKGEVGLDSVPRAGWDLILKSGR